jgi:hypothetical protein
MTKTYTLGMVIFQALGSLILAAFAEAKQCHHIINAFQHTRNSLISFYPRLFSFSVFNNRK